MVVKIIVFIIAKSRLRYKAAVDNDKSYQYFINLWQADSSSPESIYFASYRRWTNFVWL